MKLLTNLLFVGYLVLSTVWDFLRAMVRAAGRKFRFVIRDEHGDAYLVRYRLIPWGPVRLYLHHVLRSDNDRHLHDHPFDFWSLILWGGYYEELGSVAADGVFARDPPRWRGPGTLLRRRAKQPHRLILPQRTVLCVEDYDGVMQHVTSVQRPRPAWTLVLRGPKRREWGFYIDDLVPVRWLPWHRYSAYLTFLQDVPHESADDFPGLEVPPPTARGGLHAGRPAGGAGAPDDTRDPGP